MSKFNVINNNLKNVLKLFLDNHTPEQLRNEVKRRQLKFGSKKHMLKVLNQAYRYVLDISVLNYPENPRLNIEEQKQLGRDLFDYWEYNNKNKK